MTMTMPALSSAPVPGPDPVPGTLHPWRRHVALGDSFTEGIGDPGLADRTGARVADQWGLTAVHDARLWSADRLHRNEVGHREIAYMMLGVLGVPTIPR